jgi:hypothetical protein
MQLIQRNFGRLCGGLLAALFAGLTASAHADLVVPSGGSYDLAGGSTDLGCTDVIVGGTLNLSGGTLSNVRNVTILAGGQLGTGAGSITLAGDWSNAGNFNAGSGTVSFVDAPACATTSTISGNSSFNNLSLVTASGKLYRFAAGSSQRVTGVLALNGNGLPLRIESTVAGSYANIDATILQNIANIAVRDMSASGEWIAQGLVNQGAGPVYRWFGFPVVPASSPLTLVLLLLALTGVAAFWLRTNNSKHSQGDAP